MAGISKSLVEVGISMVLQDQFSQQAGKISSSYNQMMNDMSQWNRAVTQSAGAAFDYGVRVINEMTDAYQHYAKISGEMFMVGKIAGANAQEQRQLLDLTRQVNKETPLTNMDIASGERYLAMAGNRADAITKMIRPAAELASVFQMQLGGKGGTADLMTNIMATFGIASEDASKTADILYTATTRANMNLTDLAQSLSYAGADFRNAGIDISTAAAAIGVLGDQGIQASSAGTALANMIRYLTLSITGQKTKGTKMLEAMGISREDLVDAHGNLKDLGTLMKVLSTRMANLSGTDRLQAMYNIFGTRGQRASSALFQALWKGTDKMSSIINEANATDGTVLHGVMQEFLNTDMGAINQLTAAIDNLKMTIGQQEGGVFKPLITGVTWIVQGIEKLSSTGFGKLIIVMTTAVTISATIVNGIRLLSGLLRMVNYHTMAMKANASGASTGMSGMNTQAALLEGHLRTIVALMAEYVAMSYAPGTKGMMLPLGGRLGRNRAGKPYVSFKRRSMSTATYASMMAPALPSSAASSASSAAAGAATGSMAAGLGSMASFMVGGPYGMALGVALTGLSLALDYYSNSVDENTSAINANTRELSASAIQAAYQERYVKAIEQAVKASGSKSNNVNLTINGQPVGSFGGNSSVNLDPYAYYL